MFICSALWVRWDSCRSLSPNQQIIKFMSAIKLALWTWFDSNANQLKIPKFMLARVMMTGRNANVSLVTDWVTVKGKLFIFLVIFEESYNCYANNLTQFVHKFYGLSTSLQCFYANFFSCKHETFSWKYAKIISLLLSRLKICIKTVWSISSNFESVCYIVIAWSHFLL